MTDRAYVLAERIAEAICAPFDDDPTHIRPVWIKSKESGYPWGQVIAWCEDDTCRGLITGCPGVSLDIFSTEHWGAAAYLGFYLEYQPIIVRLRGCYGNSSRDPLSGLDNEHRIVFQRVDMATDGLLTYGLRNAKNDTALAWLHGALPA